MLAYRLLYRLRHHAAPNRSVTGWRQTDALILFGAGKMSDSAVILLVFLAFVSLLVLLASKFGERLISSGALTNRYAAIDGLRGFLAISVLAHHFTIWLQVTRGGNPWSAPDVSVLNQLGAGAVGLFFMITGLLFYPKILQGFGKVSWGRVYVGRVFRIMPMVALSVVIVMLITFTRTGFMLSEADLHATLRWVTASGEPGLLGDADAGRTNAYVLWSLWYEWLFYILLLPVMSLAMDFVRDRLPSWTVPTALLVASLAYRLYDDQFGLLYYAPLFAIGMLAAEVSAVPAAIHIMRRRAASVIALCALLVGIVGFPNPTGWALPLFAVFFLCVACGNDCFGVLSTRAAALLGEVSFSVYLLHGCVLSLMFVEGATLTREWTDLGVITLLPFLAVATMMVACITYRLVERPGINLGRQVTNQLSVCEQHIKRMVSGYTWLRRPASAVLD